MTVLIIAYHAVSDIRSPISIPASQLEHDLRRLGDAGFVFVTLDACADWLERKCDLPARSACVTFDDAYESVVIHGAPILQKMNVPATVFAIGARLGGDNQWYGQWRQIPRMPLATAAQLRELVSAGIAIGAHSWSHPRLTDLDDEGLRREIVEGADRLEQTLGAPVRHLAYPYGIFGPREVAVARTRFRTAVAARPGLTDRGANAHDLPRMDGHDLRLAVRAGLFDAWALRPYLRLRAALRNARRAGERLLSR
jgi:peptidoglycan/xylan/chitin deacetylase (PgdA/CDA1 family)